MKNGNHPHSETDNLLNKYDSQVRWCKCIAIDVFVATAVVVFVVGVGVGSCMTDLLLDVIIFGALFGSFGYPFPAHP
jgi:hypothetical protein